MERGPHDSGKDHMPLPSQTSRLTTTGRAYMYRRKRVNLRPVLVGAIVLTVLVGGVWALTRPGPAPADAKSPPATVATEPPKAEPAQAKPPAPAPIVRAEPPKQEPAPVEVRQGAPQRQPESTLSGAVDHKADEPVGSKPSQPAATAPPPPKESDPVATRAQLNRVLANPATPEAERATLRQAIAAINEDLMFSPRAVKNDPYVELYTVEPNDGLEKIGKKLGLSTHWRLLQRINRMSNPNSLRVGQKLKVLRGPFHAVVTKSEYRMDVYAGPADKPAEWMFVRSFRVGLGEGGSTPTGSFVVRKGSKLENPPWVNPRTGERFAADDPKNPIGERWIGLEGLGEAAPFVGYGIHGTIDSESIGQSRSMGCVRLDSVDVEIIYELLGEGASVVRITP